VPSGKTISSSPCGFHRLSLAQQIAARVREAIGAGEFAGFLPPERGLCERYRASRPVVRQAIGLLQEEGWVERRPRQCARILRASPPDREVSRPARAALLLGEPGAELSRWQLLLIDALREELLSRGVALEVAMEPGLAAVGSPERRLERLCADFAARKVDRWVLGGVSQAVQQWFFRRGMHAAVMGNAFPGVGLPFVNDDLRGTTRHAAGVFLGAGHRRIGYLLRRREWAGENDEAQGFLSAFASGGDSGATGRLLRHSGSVAAIRERLERSLSGPAAISALLVSHAEDLLVVMNWCLERGMQIPCDLSLISYQWESYLERLRPGPACYHSDPGEHARKLSRLLLRPLPAARSPLPVIPRFHRNGTVARAPVKN